MVSQWLKVSRQQAGPRTRSRQVAVIGLGRFGGTLARTLVELDHEVLGLDDHLEVVRDYAKLLTHVAQVDATDPVALKQIGIPEFETVVVGIGNNLEASVLTATAVLDLGVSNVWAKAISDQHAKILERVGVHHVVSPEADMGERVAHLVTGRMLDYIELDEDFALIETTPPSDLVGVSLADYGLRARYGVTVVCLKKAGQPFSFAHPDTVIDSGDLLIVAGPTELAEAFVDRC